MIHLVTLKSEFDARFKLVMDSRARGSVFSRSNSLVSAAVESDCPSVTKIKITGTSKFRNPVLVDKLGLSSI
jgi:hypothetical protein